jgi:hypothetical protein
MDSTTFLGIETCSLFLLMFVFCLSAVHVKGREEVRDVSLAAAGRLQIESFSLVLWWRRWCIHDGMRQSRYGHVY